jgi:hypothetical protein
MLPNFAQIDAKPHIGRSVAQQTPKVPSEMVPETMALNWR